MAHTALYRKLRSRTFSDMVGQEHIVRTLKNQITSGRISHAYLFCGIRGTGKTSAARVFSRAVNCENQTEGEPCNECPSCTEILKERSLNVLEIDAASNNGVENVREIIEDSYYPPTSGKYKMYIIDEAHMLSASAFNALLKTLEEPPEHTVFILATTDPHKIPATIHSRCQRFDFKRITSSGITGHLKAYTQREGIEITDGALSYIASVSDGAMRDALNILEQCLSFYFDETVTLEKILDLLGAVDVSVFFDLTRALSEADSLKCMEIIEKTVTDGRDIPLFVSGIITHLRNVLVSASSGASSAVDASDEHKKRLAAQGKEIDGRILLHYINTFAELSGRLKYLPNERAMLEVTCIRLCNPGTPESLEALVSKINFLERVIEKGDWTRAKPEKSETEKASAKPSAQAKPAPQSGKSPGKTDGASFDFKKIEKSWADFVSGFDGFDKASLGSSNPVYSGGNLKIIFPDKISAEIIEKKSGVFERKLKEFCGMDIPPVTYAFKQNAPAEEKSAPGLSDEALEQTMRLINFDVSVE